MAFALAGSDAGIPKLHTFNSYIADMISVFRLYLCIPRTAGQGVFFEVLDQKRDRIGVGLSFGAVGIW